MLERLCYALLSKIVNPYFSLSDLTFFPGHIYTFSLVLWSRFIVLSQGRPPLRFWLWPLFLNGEMNIIDSYAWLPLKLLNIEHSEGKKKKKTEKKKKGKKVVSKFMRERRKETTKGQRRRKGSWKIKGKKKKRRRKSWGNSSSRWNAI